MKQQYVFPCGCKFDVLPSSTDDMRVDFNPSIETLNLDCKRTWDYISDGNTKGVFQLESRLGQSLAKKLQPHNIEELAALISLMRPGCMESLIEGKSLTNHYIDRKHLREEVTYLHPILEPILNKTYGILTYQEQSMQIAQVVCDFNLQEADMLRKAIGKKKPEEMAKVKKMFLEKAATANKVTMEQAEEIFGWIEKSQRYSFNKSHAVAYAINGYLSAFAKAHFTRPFFTSYLFWAKEKTKPTEEIKELVNNARGMDIEVLPPDFRYLDEHFFLHKKIIYAGISDVRGIGESAVAKIKGKISVLESELNKKVDNWSWLEFLIYFAPYTTSITIKGLIQVGALSYFNIARTRMLYEYEIVSTFTNKELLWVKEYLKNNNASCLEDILKAMIDAGTGRQAAIANQKRMSIIVDKLKSLVNPPYALSDSAEWLAGIEESLIGIPLTCTKVDSCDTSQANCTCKEFLQGRKGYLILAVQIEKANEIKTKNGKNPGQKMAFITASDTTGSIDSVVAFPDVWKEFGGIIIEGNTVLLGGEKGRDGSFIVKKAFQI